ncbi:unnamed protein product [Paramecium sonneborni]|uniref:Uncharacterized protein n=1 Tax=Paramecium sonneborni TaxID=65129 RepID=A0A8S1QSN1_9CILI|nr:unnamed protein product [Paramecium sonneborni]
MQLFYYDVLKILSYLASKNVITQSQKEEIKNVVLKHDSEFIQKLHTIYFSENFNKEKFMSDEIIRFAKSFKTIKRDNHKHTQMKIITEETEEIEEELIKTSQKNNRIEQELF